MLEIGLGIALVKEIPVGALNLSTLEGFENHTRFSHFAPFLFDFFALFLIQSPQKMLKVGVSRVVPMKLHGVTA